ncbi:hypothetical protein [Elizabethkingia occulta]|uniref:hypothetical protein n=1 Tax=Elizabethkingia occulta TaxID=1867263 RepID=UPI00398C69BC
MKKLTKMQLKNVNGGTMACYCNGTFSGYVPVALGCVYICTKTVIKPNESTN